MLLGLSQIDTSMVSLFTDESNPGCRMRYHDENKPLNSPSLVAVVLWVAYETWTVIGCYHRLCNRLVWIYSSSAFWVICKHCRLLWLVVITTIFKGHWHSFASCAQPLREASFYRRDCARRLWKSLVESLGLNATARSDCVNHSMHFLGWQTKYW